MIGSKKRILFFSLFILTISGCTVLRYYHELRTLKIAGASQKEIQDSLDQQTELFYALRQDLKRGGLSAGMLKREIINVYGEPILIKEINGDSLEKHRFLYHHPTQYFSEDRIYLYFDGSDKLVRWEYLSAP